MPMTPLPAPPLSSEIAFGEGRRILLTQLSDFNPAPPVASMAVIVGFPLLAYGLPLSTPPVLCPVLAVVLVAEFNSRRW